MTVEQLIQYWSTSLSERLIEIRFVDVDDMKAAMSSHLRSALFDCLKIQLPETEKKLNEAKRKYVSKHAGNTKIIQKEIIDLKAKLKEQNKLLHTLEKFERIKQQNKWMLERHPESFREFNKYWEENFELNRKQNTVN